MAVGVVSGYSEVSELLRADLIKEQTMHTASKRGSAEDHLRRY